MRLDEIDRSLIDNLLVPVLDMRLVCNHPQLVLKKRSFMAQDKDSRKTKLFTMEKSLQMLHKKNKIECENIYRLKIMNSNAIAGIFIIKDELYKAVNCYIQTLESGKEFKDKLKMDDLQKIHAIFNYLYVIEKIKNNSNLNSENKECNIINDEKIQLLKAELQALEKKYSFNFEEKKKNIENNLFEKANEIKQEFIEVTEFLFYLSKIYQQLKF